MVELLYKDLSYKIQGALFEVRKVLGPGYKESVYKRALEEELKLRKIKFEVEKTIKLIYKNKEVGIYRPDLIADDKILLELKAVPKMPKIMETQLYYYLKATKYKLGYLVNFGSGKLDIRRRIYSK
jgi:GxxExxY protein